MNIPTKTSFLFIVLASVRYCSGVGYEIKFDTQYSPPAILETNCVQTKYSVPLNRPLSFPVKAELTYDSVLVTTGDAASAMFDVETIDSANADPDTWVTSGGELCQWGAQGQFPRRMQRKNFLFRCFNSHKLTDFKAERGLMTVDGLMHRHLLDNIPAGTRKYRFTVWLPDGTSVVGETNAFRIDDFAAELLLMDTPPTTVIAGGVFNVDVRVVNKASEVLTTGLDSCLYAELQVEWSMANNAIKGQVFYADEPKLEILYRESVRMAGSLVVTKKAMLNRVVRSQMVNGVSSFTGIKLLDVTPGIRMNITTFMQTFPFSRRPDDYDDLTGIVTTNIDGTNVFYQNYTTSKAVVLTAPIEVTAQLAKQIVILDKSSIKAIQGANFPIESRIFVEIHDQNGDRIFSGPDSEVAVQVSISSESACLSSDASFTTFEGMGEFLGSVCSIESSVSIVFAGSSSDGTVLTPDSTPTMEIVGEIHLANFIDVVYAGGDNNVGPNIESFVQFAKEDINNGVYPGLLTNRQVVVHSYDTKNNVAVTIRQYLAMQKLGENDPSQKIRAVIGFGTNTLSQKIQPLLTDDEIPQLATREDLYDFGDKSIYPYYNRISWEMGASVHSVMMAAKSRGWIKIVVLRHIDYEVSKMFYAKAKEFGIELSEVIIPSMSVPQFGTMGLLKDEMDKVKAAATKIVWVFCLAPQFWKLIREAIVAGVAPINGYQWVTMGLVSWHQPFGNQMPVCSAYQPLCTVGLTGLHGFSGTYKTEGLRTPMWEPILTRHIKKDRMLYPGTIPKHTLLIATAEFALGYDAMLLYGYALDKLIKGDETITGANLAKAVREVTINGLTGTIKLDEKGNRPGYRGFISVTDPHPPEFGTPVAGVAIMSRFFELESDTATTQLELRGSVQWPLLTYPGYGPVNPYTLPNTTFLNKRKYNGSDGMLDGYENVVAIPPATATPSTFIEMEDYAVAPYYCVKGCGGTQISEYNINLYEFGECISMDLCKCQHGYLGENCDEIVCRCRNGYCKVPEVCICEAGWLGDTCQDATCANTCQNGRCTSPDVCTCDSGYMGSTCTDQTSVVATVPLLLIICLVIGGFFFGRWFLKREALKAALTNLDWRVNWDEEVQTGVGAISMVSTAGEELTSKKNFVTWKSTRCYGQKYDCDTLDVNDISLRLEIVQIKEIRHNNLIHFVGACLEWPNVCLLVEPCPKGSLEDLLANDTVKLGWDFKFSLLKDICRGMDFLHRSEIGSHGRLKSTNCLVDNRWTCKVAGFGAPTIRFAGTRKATTKDEEPPAPERSLFWTAPELLGNAVSIDDIGQGTPAGDCYSFAIILSEVIAREEPYSVERMTLTPEDIICLLKGKDSPSAAQAKKRWYESGGDTTKLFRPKLTDTDLPEEYAAKSGMRKLIEQNWHGDPQHRLSFRQSLDKLNEIHPIKGELVDNLVNMLEKYSSNLEAIVTERTKELMVEKAKTEQLISQMLPKSVIEALKHGRVVEPESFECCTIFFSDLVGFTAIAKESTPLQVVDLLNDLYTTFDAILDNYDVYKVETIGDAYMVVSGIPIRNGDLHAGEIATMSLDLLASVCDFKIRHLPTTTLQLRIGMHSGPAVSGVVGLKMPRYCLFGDTVNTASRMESSSMALRIHMSEATANILFKLGSYHLDCRGEREVKGKGTMTTYWLEGKDGFTKPLPGVELALSASKHEFK